jgi:hypothetical protein
MEKSHTRTHDQTRLAADETVIDEDDLNKPGMTSEFSDFLTDSVRRSSQIAAENVGGFTRAVGDGFRTFGDHLTTENVSRWSLSNGFFTGTVRGYIAFFEEMAATARRVLLTAGDSPEMPSGAPRTRRRRGRVVVEEIDYERLAKLVAEEMKERELKERKA